MGLVGYAASIGDGSRGRGARSRIGIALFRGGEFGECGGGELTEGVGYRASISRISPGGISGFFSEYIQSLAVVGGIYGYLNGNRLVGSHRICRMAVGYRSQRFIA